MNALLRALNDAFCPKRALPDPDRTTVRPVWGIGRPWKPTTLLIGGPWNRP